MTEPEPPRMFTHVGRRTTGDKRVPVLLLALILGLVVAIVGQVWELQARQAVITVRVWLELPEGG